MADDRLLDEEHYFRTRGEQLTAEAERRGISRRALLTATAAGVPLLAGAGPLATPVALAADPVPAAPPPVPATAIVKPLPPEWFTIIGTNAEMRWDAVAGQGYTTAERALLRPQPHRNAADRRGDLAAARLRQRAPRRARPRPRRTFSYDELRALPSRDHARSSSAPATGAASSRASRARPHRARSGRSGAVGVGALARRAARDGARARRPRSAGGRRRDARGARRHRRRRRRRPGPRAPSAADRARRSTTRCSCTR